MSYWGRSIGVLYGERSHSTTFTESGANLYTNNTIDWSGWRESNSHLGGRSSLYYPLYDSQLILKHTRRTVTSGFIYLPPTSGSPYRSDMAPLLRINVLQYKLVGAPRFELGSDELKVRCDTVSPYPACLFFFRKALLLLRCEPAFRLLAKTA